MADALRKFGKYFLLDQIAQGGMAEIYRARMATPDGGSRLLAIKRMLPSYSQNPEFVSMFKAEITTTSGLSHPNVVSLYDFGEESGMLYITMEYVDGCNLRQYTTRFTELKSVFPIEVSCYIIEQAALGMDYAHGFKDKLSGKPLNIVHRDISPQNILISFDGAVKIIDFGIAKAVTNAEATRAGVIKGKPSYLSPEQIAGDVLDGRSDLFALGVVFWELLTGRKLFASDNDYAVIRMIENCDANVKPPSSVNAKVPKELDAIVLKCLVKDRKQRYQSTGELQRALHKFLYQHAPDFNPADLAQYAREMFKNEIVEDRQRLLRLNEKAEQLLTAGVDTREIGRDITKPNEDIELEKTTQTQTSKTKSSGSFRMVDVGKDATNSKIVLDAAQNTVSDLKNRAGFQVAEMPAARSRSAAITRPSSEAPRAENSSGKGLVFILILAVLGGGGYWLWSQQAGHKPEPESLHQNLKARLSIEGNVSSATVSIDGVAVSQTLPIDNLAVPAGQDFTLSVFSNGYKRFTQTMRFTTGDDKKVRVELVREDAHGESVAAAANGSSPQVALRIAVAPQGRGTTISLNGAPVDPSGVVTAPIESDLDLVVEREGFRSVQKRVRIPKSVAESGENAFTVEVVLEPADFGTLSIVTTPSAEGILTVDGREIRIETPLVRKALPAGSYRVKLQNRALGMEKEISFTIRKGEETKLNDIQLVVKP